MGFYEIMSLVGSVLVIILVLLLTYYGTRWYARRMGAGSGMGRYIRVVDRAVLGQSGSAVIIKAGEKYYLLGSADKNVSLICELEDFAEEPLKPVAAGLSFSRVMRAALGKTDYRPDSPDGPGGSGGLR